MAPALQMRVERVVPAVVDPGPEPVCSDSRALLLNLTLLCFPSLPYKAVFPRLGMAFGAECFFVVGDCLVPYTMFSSVLALTH